VVRSRNIKGSLARAIFHLDMGEPSIDCLERFLCATMDEIRLYYAEHYAQHVLRLIDTVGMGHADVR
jgi:hypothetical protein